MSRKTIVQLLIVIVLLSTAAWYVLKGSTLYHPAATAPKASAKATPKATPTPTPPPGTVMPVPKPPEVTDKDVFPLSRKTEPLTAAPSREGYMNAPILYLAPIYGGSGESQTTDSQNFDYMLRQALLDSKPHRLLLNLTPRDFMNTAYKREKKTLFPDGFKPEQFLRDAQLLDCGVLAVGRFAADGDKVSAMLSFTDLKTSRTDQWQQSGSESQFTDILSGAIRATAKFCGATDNEISDAGMVQGLPSAATWHFWKTSPDQPDADEVSAAIKADPGCKCLGGIAYNLTQNVTFLDAALKLHPDDLSLLLNKSNVLRSQEKYYESMLILSELVRRYPESLFVLHALPWTMTQLYPGAKDGYPSVPPPEYESAVKSLATMVAEHPNNWCLRWDYSWIAESLASYARGTRTADYVPESQWKIYSQYEKEALASIEAAAARRPDCPNLLTEVIDRNFANGNSDLDWQHEMIAKIHALDPDNVKAELSVAYSHSIGWSNGSQFLPLIQETIKNHPNDPNAAYRIATSLGNDLNRQWRFGRIQQSGIYDRNPETDLFVQQLELAINGGIQIENWLAGTLRECYNVRGEKDKLAALAGGGHPGLTADAARLALRQAKYADALDLARKALEKAQVPDARESLRYVIVKSLWKMKRYDESLSEAEAGMAEFPKKATFYYLFAVVALEHNVRLEEARRHARLAAQLDPKNQGITDTLKQLDEILSRK